MTIGDLIFTSFNGSVIAVNRDSGDVVWNNSNIRKGYMSLLLDGDRLVVSSDGYMYCLNALTGLEIWNNSLPGTGTGVPSLVSVRGQAPQISNAAADIQARLNQQASSNSTMQHQPHFTNG